MKNTTRKQFHAMIIGFLLTIYAGVPAIADDTEIFTGLRSDTAALRPNVMFILDTSHSMLTIDDGSTLTRLDRMKNALYTLLDSMTNVNVGLMRFSGDNSGGPVLYPVSYIDEASCSVDHTCGSGTASLDLRVISSADDAEQDNVSGAVDITSTTLDMVNTGACSGSLAAVTGTVDTGEDQVDATSTMTTAEGGSQLDLLYNSGFSSIKAAGVRFPGLNVPKGAYISCATITFNEAVAGVGAPLLKIYGDSDTNSNPWDCSGTHGSCITGVSNRIPTAAYANWDLTGIGLTAGNTLTTPGLSAIVQEIVNTGSWNAGHDIGFIIQKDPSSSLADSANYRVVDGTSGAKPPVLKVYYNTSSTSASSTDQTVGIRFQNVGIPQGATITSASLEFVANDSYSTPTSLVIAGEAADNASAFTTTTSDLSSRPNTASTVSWSSVSSWNTAGEIETSPDLSSVVQEIVDRSGWCGGNSLAFIITGVGQRSATAYDATPGNAPLLHVTYDTSAIPTGGGCMNTTVVKSIATSSDDAEERLSDHSVNVTSNDIDLVDDAGDQAIGLRFQNVGIAQGATVLSAKLEFQVRTAGVGSVDLDVWGESADNSSIYSANPSNITSRSKTSAKVSWASVADPAVGSPLDSPDLSTIVQEIVNRTGWASGNDMGFIIERNSTSGTTGTRTTESFDGLSSAAARLTVQVQWNSGSTSTITQTVRTKLKSIIQDLDYKAGTPTVDALYEAARYFRGEGVDYGTVRGLNASTAGNRSEYTRVSAPASYKDGRVIRDSACTDANLNDPACKTEYIDVNSSGYPPTYISPQSDMCQTDHIVLLTDGPPTSNSSASKIQTMTGVTSCADTGAEACGKELVKYLANQDQSSTYPSAQTIKTYTIGLGLDDLWLQDLASTNYGNGIYYTASTSADLASKINAILAGITTSTTSFVSPGAAVNQFNRLRHNTDIYFSLFKPNSQPLWAGNLKKYVVNPTSLEIEDYNNQPAVDQATGLFDANAESYWSNPITDGNDVTLGGAASKRSLTRHSYTVTNRYLATLSSTSTTPYNSGSGIDLTNAYNEVVEPTSGYSGTGANTPNISKGELGDSTMSDAYAINLVKWARGVDLKDYDEDGNRDEVRLQYADPLHSRPVIVSYIGDPTTTGGSATVKDVVFFATNEGFLYAIDADTGDELFNFIPNELLKNLKTLYDDTAGTAHPYGLDGAITLYHDDNGTPTTYNDDHYYLYVGMRRGGQSYYALDITPTNLGDVTNTLAPKLMWQIIGGTGGTTGYSELAQTWSAPVLTSVDIGNTVTKVLVFAGGYDPDQDGYTSTTADSQGRAIFMADALTGQLVWSGVSSSSSSTSSKTFADMKYSIPGNVRVLDTNKDGLADLMYVGDMGGQIWRFDIDNTASNAAGLVSGVVLASLSAASTNSYATDAAATRRFYNTPDVSKIKDGLTYYYAVAIGSGYRAHPLKMDSQDRFYLIRDTNYNTPPTSSSWTSITNADLYDATNDVSSSSVTGNISSHSLKGWRLDMENTGEKVLSDSVTLNNQVVFSTYTPVVATSSCSAAQGTGRTYVVNVLDATPSIALSGTTTGTLTKGDRVVELKRGGIPPSPTVLMVPNPVVLIGPETPLRDMSFGDLSQRTFWYQIDNN